MRSTEIHWTLTQILVPPMYIIATYEISNHGFTSHVDTTPHCPASCFRTHWFCHFIYKIKGPCIFVHIFVLVYCNYDYLLARISYQMKYLSTWSHLKKKKKPHRSWPVFAGTHHGSASLPRTAASDNCPGGTSINQYVSRLAGVKWHVFDTLVYLIGSSPPKLLTRCAISQYRAGTGLTRVMVCCLTTISHYMNQS